MENEFDEIMKKHSDAELVEILNSAPGDYKDAAMESARREFKSRNLSPQKIEQIKDEIEQGKIEQEVEANAPLDNQSKWSAFFFPNRWNLFSLFSKSDKDNELATYTLFGYAFYLGVLVLLSIIGYYFHWHFGLKK